MRGNPRFGGTGRNRYSDSDALFKHKPRLKGLLQGRAAVIHDVELPTSQVRRDRASLAPPQCLAWTPLQQLGDDFSGTERAEENQKSWRSGFEESCKTTRYRAQIHHAIERRKIREGSVEQLSACREILGGEAFHVFRGDDFRAPVERCELGLSQRHHGRRRIGEKDVVSARSEERRIFAGAAA